MADTLQDKISKLTSYLAELRAALDNASSKQLEATIQRAIERLVQMVVECSADCGDLWLAENGRERGVSAAHTFQLLMDAGVIDTAIRERFRRHVSFRNLVVHDYDMISGRQAREAAAGLLADVPLLIRALEGRPA